MTKTVAEWDALRADPAHLLTRLAPMNNGSVVPALDDTDAELLAAHVSARLDTFTGVPREGDLIEFTNGLCSRIAADHSRYGLDGFQPGTLGLSTGRLHLAASGHLSYSGTLSTVIPSAEFTDTGTHQWAPAWIWHHGRSGGGRGRDVTIPVRAWSVPAEHAPRF